MYLIAQDPTGLSTGWVNAGLGGIAVFAIATLAYFFKLWVEERRLNSEAVERYSSKLVDVISKSNDVISGNTMAINLVCKQSDQMTGKVDDLRERMIKLKCLVENPTK